jgi:hypothetical protein
MKKIYRWIDGAPFNADPQAVGEAIADLDKPTAERIVRAAEAKRSPLHELFDWDDASAAKEHRLTIARALSRSLVISVKIDREMEPITIRAFEAVTLEPGEAKVYMPTMKVLSKDEWREEVIGRLRMDLKSAKRQLEAYAHLSNQIVVAGEHVGRAIKVLDSAA